MVGAWIHPADALPEKELKGSILATVSLPDEDLPTVEQQRKGELRTHSRKGNLS
jgi:hypothetical protein